MLMPVRVTFYTCSALSVNESGGSGRDGADGEVFDDLARGSRGVADGTHQKPVGARLRIDRSELSCRSKGTISGISPVGKTSARM
jgi:hypothetical protein